MKLMEVCGTHTMQIARHGIKKLLPLGVELISGPGCPVCVTSQADIDTAIEIARIKDVIMTSFGDMIRVPGTNGSLEDARRDGADVRIVYSCLDALNIARSNPDKKIVFMGIGFETTSPTIASTVITAKKQKIKNFFLLSNFKLLFPALKMLSSSKRLKVDGFICPGHVSVITGSSPYKSIAKNYKKPCVITGFGPSDMLRGIKQLIDDVNNHSYGVEIAYKRAVNSRGNTKALRVLRSVFKESDSVWRGMGVIKKSGLELKREYKNFDAKKKFKVRVPKSSISKECLCGEVLQGIKSPRDCKLFKKVCTPQKPVGPCMVSSEGTCAAHFHFGDVST